MGKKEKVCIWREDLDGGYWGTSCGEQFTLLSDTPEDNNMKYCCYCGRELEEGEGSA